MDEQIVSLVKASVPVINPDIANGLAVKHMKQTAEYIDAVFEVVSKNFPPELKYLGCDTCTPEEEFNFGTAKKNSKRQFDVARSDMFLMKFYFSFNGEPLKAPRYAYLPFVTDAGAMVLNGTRYFVTPSLTDTTFSPSEKGVFIRLLRDRLNFERTPYHILMDDTPVTIQVAHSMIHHNTQKNKEYRPTIKASCTLAHYLFCKYGVEETFKKFVGITPMIGTTATITENTYPNDSWTIFRSRKVKPLGYGKHKYLTVNDIAIAIPKHMVNKVSLGLIGGFFYVTDYFPESMKAEWINDTSVWRVVLGVILFGNQMHTGRIIEEIADHLNSLDDYVDSIVHEKLKRDGYKCDDIYELFIIVIDNIDDWVRSAPKTINSMYGKELTVLYNTLYHITSSIFNMYFKIKATSKRGLKERDVENIMNAKFRAKSIYSITKGHTCVKLESYSGDNKFFGITTSLVPQKNSSSKTGARERPSLKDNSKKLHVSVAEIGGFSNLPKNEPDGRACINPHVHIDAKGLVLRDPSKLELLNKIQEMLTAPPTM